MDGAHVLYAGNIFKQGKPPVHQQVKKVFADQQCWQFN